MLIIKILHYLRGYVRIKLTGSYLERFINLCAYKNIYIWDIQTKGTRTMTAKTSVRGYKKLHEICTKTNTKIHILSKKGLPFILRRILRRKGLVFGFALFIFLIVWLCSHIWYVEIMPSDEYDHARLMEQLAKAGVRPGVSVWSVDPDKVQAEMLSINPGLSWLWPEVRGTKVFVDYRVRVQKPEILDVNKPCNLVARQGGRVTALLIKEGRKLVTQDMWVSKGQLLVSGVMDSKVVGVRFVHADGEVWVDATHTLSGQYQLAPTIKQPTGRVSNKYTLQFGNVPVPLPLPFHTFAESTEKKESHPLKIGDIYFPVSLVKISAHEVVDKKTDLPKEQIIHDAQEYLLKVLQNDIENGIIKEKNFAVADIDENTVEVKLEALCNQQIAQKQPIEEETKENGGENH